ncbi:MAG TPA: radical SAM protein, partial [Pyrinomonadaceae bacterium]|nr:radical SAM protein [Pyrinomonadaceae bacterium]
MSRRLPLYGEAVAVADGPSCSTNQPADAEVHLFNSWYGRHAFVVRGSQIFDVVPEFAVETTSLAALLTESLGPENKFADACRSPSDVPAIRSISLNVAQGCNLSCVYCYADSGKFGGSARMMKLEVARETADLLINESEEGAQLLLGFMGGEPILNRTVLHEVTRYAAQKSKAAGRSISFSITTNGTLISRSDVELFASYPFTVQISLDGGKTLNDSLRPAKDGSGSFDRVVETLKLFNRFGRPKHLAARVTVTPKTGRLLPILE